MDFGNIMILVGQLLKKVKIKNGKAKVSKKQLANYIGDYKTNNGDIRRIFMEHGQLYSQRENSSKLFIFPETDTRFYYGFDTNLTIEFITDRKMVK